MIDLIFNFANEVVLIKIAGTQITFGNTAFGARMASLKGLRLDFHGTIREFPDLEGEIDWREKAIERFEKHIGSLNGEDAIADYIIKELRSKGYSPQLKQKAGFRPVKIS